MIKSKKVYPPLIRYCAKVIPLAFDESLSYYECICNIANHINNEIIPKVNESNEIVNEVQKEFVELKDYVDDNMLTKDINDLTYYTLTSDLSSVALSGNYNDLTNKPTIPDVSNFITKNVNDLTYYTLSSNLSSVATSGNYNDLSNKPTIPIKMVILKYGTSTWQDFINAYNENAIVYCRASSNSNPATGSQTRLAFMAYVNNETSPTSVEFQYYRSVSSHSDSQQGDQVFVYSLTNSGTWTVTTRNTFSKIIAGTNLSSSYSNGNLTINGSSEITDSGTNYIKYSDGTVIQWGVIDKSNFVTTSDLYTTIQNINIYRSNNPSFNFPIAFINTNYSISFEGYNGTNGCRLITTRLNAKTETGFSVQLIGLESFTSSETGYTNLINVNWIAIGKWK